MDLENVDVMHFFQVLMAKVVPLETDIYLGLHVMIAQQLVNGITLGLNALNVVEKQKIGF